MVKGISKQVIVVQSPDQKLFEQAIFILKEDALDQNGITDEALLKEANQLLHSGSPKKRKFYLYGPVWAFGGAVLTSAVWFISRFL